jgi:hypothetical protein
MPMSWSGGQFGAGLAIPKHSATFGAFPSGEEKAVLFCRLRADERNPQVSPDGNGWPTLQQTGKPDLHPAISGGGQDQVSVNGGVFRAGAATAGSCIF